METTESIFKLIHYRYSRVNKSKLHYPRFRVYMDKDIYFKTLTEVEGYMQEVARRYTKYLETHSGFELCDHAQSTVFGRFLDTYEVISNSKIGIDHASTISVFEPTKKVSKRRQEALRDLYRRYSNQCKQHSAISD